MKILQLHHYYAERGGEDAVVDAEREVLLSRGHEVRLLSRSSKAMALGGAFAALAVADNQSAARELAAALDDFKPDVVHAHNLFPGWGLAPLEVLIRRRQAAVQTLHNFRWLCAKATLLRDGNDCRLCAEGDFWPALRYACFRDSRLLTATYAWALSRNRKTHLAVRAFGRLICVSDFVKRTHAEAGFGAGRLQVKGHFSPEAPGPLEDDGGVVFIGRLAEEKGFAVLANAMARMPEARLTVIGDGPERAAWESKLGSRARFMGRLERPQMLDILRRARVCVVPSLGTETFGLTALEAMACGKPVLASDAGGLPELVEDGVNGFVVPRGNAEALFERLQILLNDRELAAPMGAAGLEKASRYLPDANMADLESIYRGVIEENKNQ